MSSMTVLEIIQLVAIGLIVLGVLTYLVVNAIKNKWISKLINCIETSIKEAEIQWPEGHGSEKLEYVLEKVKAKCEELKIPYMLVYKLIKAVIEKIISHYNVIAK